MCTIGVQGEIQEHFNLTILSLRFSAQNFCYLIKLWKFLFGNPTRAMRIFIFKTDDLLFSVRIRIENLIKTRLFDVTENNFYR